MNNSKSCILYDIISYPDYSVINIYLLFEGALCRENNRDSIPFYTAFTIGHDSPIQYSNNNLVNLYFSRRFSCIKNVKLNCLFFFFL